MPDLIAFGPSDEVEAHLTEVDGVLCAVFGVAGDRGVVMPLVLLLHVMTLIEGVSAQLNIAINEADTATKH
ncbi:hypothetical protein [Rhodopseudomonas palustris]|uniref:hypothetical protein n=1 Tax=Rhodopseudomonas palustris TaxID=1076 RepID=UPI0021F2D401|nr:hypothetical protein [Rhodopseudomonas palustris]UYO52516.1 hypothetical protein KQX61_18235 [Rhodopseudomonas palustris]